ncbi:MAG: hypothetical protein IJ715_00140 [Bacilli bacterium]|nr:hypothetical protein [Bacilli bacterium]
MYDQYLIENLMIGNRITIAAIGGKKVVTSYIDGPYIFYKVPTEEGKKQKYLEIFTEDVYKLTSSVEKQKFGKTYVSKINNIEEYLTKEEIEKQYVSKARLLDIYNVIRARSLESSKQKTR